MKRLLLLAGLLVSIQQLNAQDGTLDLSFGNNGANTFNEDFVNSALAPDGKIVAIRRTPYYLSYLPLDIIRLNPDGTLDETFGIHGIVTTILQAVDIKVQQDGKIVVLGTKFIGDTYNGGLSGRNYLATTRYNANGTLDNFYGGATDRNGVYLAGTTLFEYSYGYAGAFSLIIAPPRDEVIISYEAATTSSRKWMLVFAEQGYVTTMIGTPTPLYTNYYYPTNPISVLALPTGGFILGGNESGVYSPQPYPGALFPFTTRLLLTKGDPSFGDNGKVVLPGFGGISSLVLQADNKFLGCWNDSIFRFNADGTLDPTFGNNGVAKTGFHAITLLIQPNGRIIVGGTLNGDFALTRLNSNGSIDQTFGTNGLTITDVGADKFIRELAIAGETLFAYGRAIDYNTNVDNTLAAYHLSSTCTPPTFLNTQPIVGNATCGNNDGQISVIPQSGTAPYLYSLDGGATYVSGPDAGFTQFNLAAGIYQLRLKDANGCESEVVTRQVSVQDCPPTTCTPPTFLNSQPIMGNATCGQNDGQISIIPTSGTGPFMYSFDGGATYISGPNVGLTRFNLPAGTYQLRLKDASGCESAVITRELRTEGCPTCTPPTFLNTRPIIGDATCNQSDGQISVIPTSGTGPFMYSINGGANYVAGPNAGYTFFNLPAGPYQLRLKDANSCESDVVTREVRMINCPSSTPTIAGVSKAFAFDENTAGNKLQLLAYPNPSKGRFKLQVLQSVASKAEVFIYDAKGTMLQQAIINPAKGSTIEVNLSVKARGLYHVKVVTQQGISTSKILLQ